MASWSRFESEAPELAGRVQALLDAHRHKVLGTLRKDGSPRLSGIEVSLSDGELWFGGMWMSRKCLDLRRDPRFALHSASADPPDWEGDARLAGRAEEVADGAGTSHLFRADLQEAVVTRLGHPADHLVVEWWRPGAGVMAAERR